MSDCVLFTELEARNGMKIGRATLNSEKSINALSLDMIDLMYPKFQDWATDPSIAAVVLDGAGERGFCAGGDVRQLWECMQQDTPDNRAYCEGFFTREYRLDHLLHRFPKPLLVWGGGFVMGGGMGLMAGASHKVVTETTRIGMPEITIALFPDVGGSYFLNRLPAHAGMFLGLTACQINGTDALDLGMADRLLKQESRAELLDAMQSVEWSKDGAANHRLLDSILRRMEQDAADVKPAAQVVPRMDIIRSLIDRDSLSDIMGAIEALETDDKWLQKARAAALHGSPAAAHLIYEMLQRGQRWSLEETFRRELDLAVNCTRNGEFSEGVRALLVDKDRTPKWLFASVDEVPAEWVQSQLQSPWDEENHPLQSLS
ncbi:enoyl-CoA hydratase/isomerase family protein [Spongorhabdus nitratireducens]